MTYDFTADWFSGIKEQMLVHLSGYVGKDGVRVLEIGSFEGRSSCWFLDEVLTGKGCELVCVDPWVPYDDKPDTDWAAVEERWRRNVGDRATHYVRLSDAAEDWWHAAFDVAFIDGDHAAHAVLNDAVRAWDMLKVGGLVIFDDYGAWRRPEREWDIPKTAVDAFTACYEGRFEVLRKSEIVVLRKMR